jgi:putative addiction module killer protein
VNTIIRTRLFDGWLAKLKDLRGKARIIERIRSAERGNFGDCHSVGDGVSELRLHYGPGYRVYFCRTSDSVYVLLCGGTKRRQRRDIRRAQRLARTLMED